MKLEVFLEAKIYKRWFSEISDPITDLYQYQIHSSLSSLKNELDLKLSKTNVLCVLDVNRPSTFEFANLYIEVPNVKFLFVGVSSNLDELINYFKHNIHGYLTVTSSYLEFINAYEKIKKSKLFLPESLKEDLLVNLLAQNGIKKAPYNDLNKMLSSNNSQLVSTTNSITEKEKIVCELLTRGLSYKEIANVIGLSYFSVNQRAKSIYKKLNVKSRSELTFKVLS
jgi:DNA-binding NarL/FixJ family response regulator